MTAQLAPFPMFKAFDNNGAPLFNGQLFTYIAGSSTPQATYVDSTQTTQNTNPVILNARGEASVWFDPTKTYKLVLQDSVGNQIWSVDQIQGNTVQATAIINSVVTQSYIGQTLYPRSGAEVTAGVTPTSYWFPVGNVMRYGAIGNGVANDAPAIQAAVNVAAAGVGQVTFPPGNYNITTCIDVTSDVTKNRSGIKFMGTGRRGAVTITGSTGNWMFDFSGSPWTSWQGLFLVQGASTPSYGGFIACTTNYAQPSYFTFLDVYVQLYNLSAPALFGTVGFALMGAEEGSFLATQTFANTPAIVSSSYSIFSASYPSPFQNANVLATQSQGVTTWGGENLLATFDQIGTNLVIYGANTIYLGNMHFSNANIGTPGTSYKCISILGGTLEGLFGQIKIEQRQTAISIDQYTAQVMGWDLRVTYGAGVTATNGVIEVNTGNTNVWQGDFHSIKVGVYYETLPGPSGKALIVYNGIVNAGANVPSLANISIETNQTLAQAGGVPSIPSIFCGIVNSYDLKYVDVNYWYNAHRQIKRSRASTSLGLCAANPGGTGQPIATVTFPPIIAGAEARTYQVRVRGMLSTIFEAGGGGDTNISVTPFDTVVSGYSNNAGTITASSGGSSDLIFTPVSTNISNASASFLLTGVNVTQSVIGRVLTLTAKPYGTGTAITTITAYANDVEVELITSGRISDSIYLT